jgi:putative nucleic acid binding protein
VPRAGLGCCGDTLLEGRKNKILFPSLLIVPLLALVWAIATQSPLPHVTATTSDRQPQQRTIYRATAAELYRDYNADAAATQARIGQRRIVVTGTVVAVSKDYLGQNLLLLDAGNGISTVDMALAADQNALVIRLRAGQTVSVSCHEMARYSDAPTGSNCSLIEPQESSPQHARSAGESEPSAART